MNSAMMKRISKINDFLHWNSLTLRNECKVIVYTVSQPTLNLSLCLPHFHNCMLNNNSAKSNPLHHISLIISAEGIERKCKNRLVMTLLKTNKWMNRYIIVGF